MQIDYEDVYDVINLYRIKAGEEEYTAEEVLDLVEQEISRREAESF